MKHSHIRISAYTAADKLVASQSIPVTGDPRNLYEFVIKQALPGLATALRVKQQLVMVVAPAWKVWVIRHVLRCMK